jgi:hypothetical protein
LTENECNTIITSCSPYCPLSIGYDEIYIEESVDTKFLGLQIDNHLSQNNHNG